MKTLIMSLSLLVIVGCASQADYRPASDRGFGYSDHKISDEHYRVHYRQRGDNTAKALDLATLRAAELTLLNQYEWFAVVSRDTISEQPSNDADSYLAMSQTRQTTTHCGLLTCTQQSHPTQQMSAGIELGQARRGEIEVILEIRMGRGVQPANNSYDALEVEQHLSEKYQD